MAANNPIADMLALLCSTFRCEIDSYQKRAYMRALDGIHADVLLAAADALIDQAAAGRKFFPMPTSADVKGACAKVIADRRKTAARLHLAACEHSSHFIETDTGMVRCPCWTRAHQAMLDVGQPIALPAAPTEAES